MQRTSHVTLGKHTQKAGNPKCHALGNHIQKYCKIVCKNEENMKRTGKTSGKRNKSDLREHEVERGPHAMV
jgi:hypothetical protein